MERFADEAGTESRKVHVGRTSRVGGIAVAAGVIAGAMLEWELEVESHDFLLLAFCAAPAFAWGLIEDVSKRGAVKARLALTAVSAMLAFTLFDAQIVEVDVPGLDNLLRFEPIMFVFTIFAITGVANAVNVVDGLNGLSGFTSLLAAIGLATVAWINGDAFICSAAILLGASVAGFLAVNFPHGRIFLGDGGAYLVGLLLAVLSVLLVQRNSEVSPWFPLLLLAYPIWETLFSAYRRRIRGRSPGEADALHLHTLVYRRVVRLGGLARRSADHVRRNALASVCVWPLPLLCFAVALLFWDQSLVLQFAALAFVVLYYVLYQFVVRFRVPSWVVIRAKAGPRKRFGAADLSARRNTDFQPDADMEEKT